MKKITLLFTFLTATFGFSQNDINFDASSTNGTGWIGYMTVFENPKNGTIGAYQFEGSWGVADLVAVVDTPNNMVTLKPNRIGDTNIYWQTPGVLEGNKIMQATFYLQDDNLAGTSFTFNANILGNTLDGSSFSIDYTYKAFIKVFAADYSSVLNEVNNTVLSGGDFTLSMDASTYVSGEHIQYGFEVVGPNASSDGSFDSAYDGLGGIIVGPNTTLSTNNLAIEKFILYPNPTNDSWTVKTNNVKISSIYLYDILGKQVMTLTPNTSEAKIDASTLSKGLYFAKIATDNGSSSLKLIKN